MPTINFNDVLTAVGKTKRPISINDVANYAGLSNNYSIKDLIRLLVFPVMPSELSPNDVYDIEPDIELRWDPDPAKGTVKARKNVVLSLDNKHILCYGDKYNASLEYDTTVTWVVLARNDWTDRCIGIINMKAPYAEASFKIKKEPAPSLAVSPLSGVAFIYKNEIAVATANFPHESDVKIEFVHRLYPSPEFIIYEDENAGKTDHRGVFQKSFEVPIKALPSSDYYVRVTSNKFFIEFQYTLYPPDHAEITLTPTSMQHFDDCNLKVEGKNFIHNVPITITFLELSTRKVTTYSTYTNDIGKFIIFFDVPKGLNVGRCNVNATSTYPDVDTRFDNKTFEVKRLTGTTGVHLNRIVVDGALYNPNSNYYNTQVPMTLPYLIKARITNVITLSGYREFRLCWGNKSCDDGGHHFQGTQFEATDAFNGKDANTIWSARYFRIDMYDEPPIILSISVSWEEDA